MIEFLVGFVLGLFLGAVFMGLMVAASRGEKR